MKVRVVKDSRLARLLLFGDNTAITLYPFLLFKESDPPMSTIRHEFIHVRQVRKLGWFKFYFLYLVNKSFRNRVETMAYKHQSLTRLRLSEVAEIS